MRFAVLMKIIFCVSHKFKIIQKMCHKIRCKGFYIEEIFNQIFRILVVLYWWMKYILKNQIEGI